MNQGAAGPVLAACAAVAGVLAMVVACIPDLPADAPLPVTPPHCGDGVIDFDAGEQCDPGPGAGDAGLGGCSAACQIQCDGGLAWPRNNHCYQVVAGAAASLASASGSASSLCQQGNGHLVTFASDGEFSAISGYFDAGSFWVGLSRDPTSQSAASYKPISPSLWEPGWSPQCSGCYAFTLDASAPLAMYPDASPDGGAPGCIVAFSDPQQPWQQYPCSIAPSLHRRLPIPQVICEREPVGKASVQCEAGICLDLVATYGQKRYVYEETPATPDDASAGCLALGGRLVVLQSQDEREQLWRELSLLTVEPFAIWIGLAQAPNTVTELRRGFPSTTESVWQWDDGQPMQAYPSEWGNSQPRPPTLAPVSRRACLWQQANEDNTLAHNDQTDFTTLPFVCEITPATLAAAAEAAALTRDASIE